MRNHEIDKNNLQSRNAVNDGQDAIGKAQTGNNNDENAPEMTPEQLSAIQHSATGGVVTSGARDHKFVTGTDRDGQL